MPRGIKGSGPAATAPTRAPVPRVQVNVTRRDPLTVPTKYQQRGFVNRWIAMGNDPMDTEARVEEMEELGYTVVKDEGGDVVRKRNMILTQIPRELYDARQQAKVDENQRQNRAQADARRREFRSHVLGGDADGRVIGEGAEIGEPEPLVTPEDQAAWSR